MTVGGLAASRELIAGQLSALPQLLKLGAPVLEPDLHLGGHRRQNRGVTLYPTMDGYYIHAPQIYPII